MPAIEEVCMMLENGIAQLRSGSIDERRCLLIMAAIAQHAALQLEAQDVQ